MPEDKSDRYISDPHFIDVLVQSLQEVICGLRKPGPPPLAAGETANERRWKDGSRSERRLLDERRKSDQESHVTRAR